MAATAWTGSRSPCPLCSPPTSTSLVVVVMQAAAATRGGGLLRRRRSRMTLGASWRRRCRLRRRRHRPRRRRALRRPRRRRRRTSVVVVQSASPRAQGARAHRRQEGGGGKGGGGGSDRDMRWAEQLLNPCAVAVEAGNLSRVQHLFYVLGELESFSGDANHRLAAHGCARSRAGSPRRWPRGCSGRAVPPCSERPRRRSRPPSRACSAPPSSGSTR